ncbi:osmotically inducible protein OsmC [Bergeyella porcorum]|uniref:Osmotically inducible protein OsmC n=1 Tax=Bergeyella porcorum TaxID=1735111 RepID=A0AAU0EZ92_9FLAO
MAKVSVKAELKQENQYYTKVTAGNHTIYTDEPIDKGGEDKGMNPLELLAASLATCTAATLKMYVLLKNWEVPTIDVDVALENDNKSGEALFERSISFGDANLTEDQQKRLLSIAERCPVHKLLHGKIGIKTAIL